MIEIQELLQSGQPPEARLAEDVVFCSPVAEYRGRADVAHMFGLISRVLSELQPARTWPGDGDGESVQAFTARAAGRELEGIVREQQAPSGEITRLTLFLRPYFRSAPRSGTQGRPCPRSRADRSPISTGWRSTSRT